MASYLSIGIFWDPWARGSISCPLEALLEGLKYSTKWARWPESSSGSGCHWRGGAGFTQCSLQAVAHLRQMSGLCAWEAPFRHSSLTDFSFVTGKVSL